MQSGVMNTVQWDVQGAELALSDDGGVLSENRRKKSPAEQHGRSSVWLEAVGGRGRKIVRQFATDAFWNTRVWQHATQRVQVQPVGATGLTIAQVARDLEADLVSGRLLFLQQVVLPKVARCISLDACVQRGGVDGALQLVLQMRERPERPGRERLAGDPGRMLVGAVQQGDEFGHRGGIELI